MICNDIDLIPDEKINAIKLISSACGKNGMVYGQFLDIENESKEINKETIENIHSLKTGKLIECSVMLGQIGNNITQQNEMLLKFSKKIGLAFQITDDILEVISDEKTLGKNINSDTKNKKSTYINVVGIDEAINRSKELSESAILDISALKLKKADMLIELAKYISYRER